MKSSKHVETCFVRANNDFDDKLTAFWMKNNFWTKIPKNGHCVEPKKKSSEIKPPLILEILPPGNVS